MKKIISSWNILADIRIFGWICGNTMTESNSYITECLVICWKIFVVLSIWRKTQGNICIFLNELKFSFSLGHKIQFQNEIVYFYLIKIWKSIFQSLHHFLFPKATYRQSTFCFFLSVGFVSILVIIMIMYLCEYLSKVLFTVYWQLKMLNIFFSLTFLKAYILFKCLLNKSSFFFLIRCFAV